MSNDAEYQQWRENTMGGWFHQAAGIPPPPPPRELREYLTEPGVNVERLLSDPRYLQQLQLRDRFKGIPNVEAPPVEEILARMRARQKLEQSVVTMGRGPDGHLEWQGPADAVAKAKQQDAMVQQRARDIAAGRHSIYPGSDGVAGPT